MSASGPHRSSYLILSHFPGKQFFCNSKFSKLRLFTEPCVVPSDVFQCCRQRPVSSSLVMIRAPDGMPVQDLTRRPVIRRDNDPLVSRYVTSNSDIVTVRYQHGIFIQVSQRQQLFPAEHQRHLLSAVILLSELKWNSFGHRKSETMRYCEFCTKKSHLLYISSSHCDSSIAAVLTQITSVSYWHRITIISASVDRTKSQTSVRSFSVCSILSAPLRLLSGKRKV